MTKQVKIGKINIGGGNRVAIQSMTNTPTKDIDATIKQIFDLENAGCDIVRVAVLDEIDAHAISDIKLRIHIPIVADIHFDYLLALEAIKNGADKIRINPSNIGAEEKVLKIIEYAKSHNTSIRIGVNSGSIDKEFLQKYPDKTHALVNSLLSEVAFFEKHSFDNLVLSLKSSSVKETVEANRLISKLTSYPLHIGVTEAGVPETGLIKNSIGIGSLLLDGIGDTVRVSLTCNPVEEVYAAKKILNACGKSIDGLNFVSCPTCGR
jgi:(E)-4-hydroxy-3-methylbut-2-enyl-diphosphate synthase